MNKKKWINWTKYHSIADEYGKVEPYNPTALKEKTVSGYFHAYGINGLEGVIHEPEDETPIVSPKTKRMYTATIKATQPRDWPAREHTKYVLQHVQEHTGMEEMANQISDAMDFMDVTNENEVRPNSTDSLQPSIESHDLVKNLYEKRPEFPRVFSKLSRAQFVAEVLIKRRDANLPITPKNRNS